MKSIHISRKLKIQLNELLDDNESIDKLINRLLDSVEEDLKNRELVDGHIIINVYPDTLERLSNLKVSDKDSYTKLLSDAVSLYNSRV